MKINEIKVTRVYMMESEHHLARVLKLLHDEIKVKHVTVLRGIEGFENGGKKHSFKIVDLSLNLPLIVEFFDTPEQTEKAIEKLDEILDEGHIVTHSAQIVAR